MSRAEFEAAVAATVARAPQPTADTRARIEHLLRPAVRRTGGGAR